MRLLSCLLLLVAAWGCTRKGPTRRGVELLPAPASGEIADLVRSELDRARSDGRDVLVYVGATWCEPCQRFHQAAASGALDGRFPGLRLLEFDLDRDGERLLRAGYQSRYIPLFARPAPDGRASGRFIEGSIKGDGAVAEIAPRLESLLAAP